jgi:hypothetical protein
MPLVYSNTFYQYSCIVLYVSCNTNGGKR